MQCLPRTMILYQHYSDQPEKKHTLSAKTMCAFFGETFPYGQVKQLCYEWFSDTNTQTNVRVFF